MFNLVIDEEKCTGCRACEIACSYHHKKVFDPQISSIEISKQGKEESIFIMVHKDLSKGLNKHLVCDRCGQETEPWCVKYCEWGAIQVVSQSKRAI